jgi:hypothetical protein
MKKKKCMMKWAGLIPLALQVTPCTSAKAGVMWGSVRKCRLMTLKEINIPAAHYFSQVPLMATGGYSSTGLEGDRNTFIGGSWTALEINAF